MPKPRDIVDPVYWKRIQDLFATALELSPNDRAEFLATACEGDDDVREEIDSLLAAHDPAVEELEQSPLRFDQAADAPVPVRIPGYDIFGELGRGGQGVVYRALQRSTRREVALKVLLRGPFALEANKRRFEREVELVGRLRHPGIVPVFDSGESHGQSFYAMELVSGIPLHHYARNDSVSENDKLQIFIKICNAVGYAHQQGVIHRDLKPSNVLIDDSGRPSVLDFGLAKVGGDELDLESTHSTISQPGDLMGTLSYMSPEQAGERHSQVDTRSDVYSLGVMLYEFLFRELPYELEGTLLENIHTIQNVEVGRPTGHGNSELLTIIQKATAKDKSRRYSNATELADDLNRLIEGQPIEAKRDSSLYVIGKLMRRHSAVATVAIAFLALLTVSSIVSWSLYLRTKDARNREQFVANRLRDERDRVETLRRRSQRQLYRAEMNLAGQGLGDDAGIARVEELVRKWQPSPEAAPEAIGWEWHYLKSHCDVELVQKQLDSKLWTVSYGPEKTLAVGGANETGLITPLSAGRTESIRIPGHSMPIRDIEFSCDATMYASASTDMTVQVFHRETNRRLALLHHSAHVLSIDWHPLDGNRLATSSVDGKVRIVVIDEQDDSGTARTEVEFSSSEGCHDLMWSPSAKYLAVCTWTGEVIVWDVESRAPVLQRTHDFGVFGVAWSPDELTLAAVAHNGLIYLRDISSGDILWRQSVGKPIWNVAFHPDGTQLATVGDDRTIRIWSATDGRPIRTIRGHTAPIWGLAWNEDGSRIATAAHDRTYRIWDSGSTNSNRTFTLPEDGGAMLCVRFSPNGRELLLCGHRNTAYLMNASTGKVRLELTGHTDTLLNAALSPDGKRIVTGARDGTAIVWHSTTGEVISQFTGHQPQSGNLVHGVDFSPDGNEIVSSAQRGPIYIWDPETAAERRKFDVPMTIPLSAKFSPDTQQLAIAAISGSTLINVQNGSTKRLKLLHEHGKSVSWSPNGQLLALGENLTGQIAIYNRNGDMLHVLSDHVGGITTLAWHPAGDRLASCSTDATIRIWDIVDGAQTLVIRGHSGVVHGLDWSPDGKQLVSVGDDGQIRIWDATTGYSQQQTY